MENVTLLPVSAASTHTCKDCPDDEDRYFVKTPNDRFIYACALLDT